MVKHVEPDEAAHDELLHLDLCCLKRPRLLAGQPGE